MTGVHDSSLFTAANHEAALTHFQALLRTSDAKVREREQVISRLKLEISQLRKSGMGLIFDAYAGGDETANKSNTQSSGLASADSILKQSTIDALTSELEELKSHSERKQKALSLELARIEASQRTHQRAFQSERDAYKTQISQLQRSLNGEQSQGSAHEQEVQAVKQKNEKLVLRLETVQKYMELLPTREEHMSLDRERQQLKLEAEHTGVKLEASENRNESLIKELINRDEKLNELAQAATELRERLSQTTVLLERERFAKTELATSLNSEERQQLQKLRTENGRLKEEMARSFKLQQVAVERLSVESKELKEKDQNQKVDLARERAVAETLRQALIDQQTTIERLEAGMKSKEETIRLKDVSITELEIDLGDAKSVFKTSELMKEVSAVLDDVSRDICTIMKIIDRQLLDKDNKSTEQDIMDVSRLLACSLDTNKAIGFDKAKVESKRNALCTAQDQLTAALALRDEVDKLRLKLSDRWTEHLTSDCKVM